MPWLAPESVTSLAEELWGSGGPPCLSHPLYPLTLQEAPKVFKLDI